MKKTTARTVVKKWNGAENGMGIKPISEKDIKKINDWFAAHEDEPYKKTHHRANTGQFDGLYYVYKDDFEEFCSFMHKEFPNMIYFGCRMGIPLTHVVFSEEDLKTAMYCVRRQTKKEI